MLFVSFCNFAIGQKIADIKWYSETTSKGVIIQNSFPKGGPYKGAAGKNFNYSYLIFFSSVTNETGAPLELTINFPADSFAIPSSPDTFFKIFLPPDIMTPDKVPLFNYGLTSIESFLNFTTPTRLQKTINPKEQFLFYIGTVFYQTKDSIQYQSRGGNRAELILKGQDLFYKMIPQIDDLPCGHIISQK